MIADMKINRYSSIIERRLFELKDNIFLFFCQDHLLKTQ